MLLFAGFCLAGFNSAYAQKEETKVLLVSQNDTDQVLSFTMSAMQVIDAKCLGCHSPGGKSDKAKDKLMWEKLQKMDAADAVAKLDEIIEVLEEGEMPPKKMIEKYPSMKLSAEESATLTAWAEASMKKAMGE